MPEIGYLLDRLAIWDVMVRYATAADARDMARFRTCVTDDVIVQYQPGDSPMQGADAYLAFTERRLKRYGRSQHLIGNQVVELHGDRAVVRTDVQVTRVLLDEPDAISTLWATYVDEMVKRDGEWHICRHEVVRTALQTTAGPAITPPERD
jgi:ketosteroid isomerase-like protein